MNDDIYKKYIHTYLHTHIHTYIQAKNTAKNKGKKSQTTANRIDVAFTPSVNI
jgi:hypothetical protein